MVFLPEVKNRLSGSSPLRTQDLIQFLISVHGRDDAKSWGGRKWGCLGDSRGQKIQTYYLTRLHSVLLRVIFTSVSWSNVAFCIMTKLRFMALQVAVTLLSCVYVFWMKCPQTLRTQSKEKKRRIWSWQSFPSAFPGGWGTDAGRLCPSGFSSS